MKIAINLLAEAYKKHIESKETQNYSRNKKLFEGDSVSVFYEDVVSRVKLEYMGVLDSNDRYYIFNKSGAGFEKIAKPFENLIVGNNILGAVTKLYAEFASNTEPVITIEEDKKKILSQIDLQDKVAEGIAVQSYAGKLLLKGFLESEEFYMEIIEPFRYFAIKEYGIIRGYVIFGLDKKVLRAEIYTKGQTEYRMFKVLGNGYLEEKEYEPALEDYGAVKDGKGYVKKYEGWQVSEVNNLFNRSDYLEDLVKLNRELVIGDTLTSQAFDKVANPLLQVPDGALEYDDEGNLKVNIQDRVFVVTPEDKELKQVALNTKTEEWKSHRASMINQIYQNTGTNEQAFGLNPNGTIASGEAKKRDLERTIATVVSKRDRLLAGFEKVIKWGYRTLYDKDLEILITGKDILSLSVGEKIIIAVQALSAGIMSIESAIKYVNISSVNCDEELKKIKADLAYKTKLIESLQVLQALDTEERVAGMIKKQADELIKELALDEKEEE